MAIHLDLTDLIGAAAVALAMLWLGYFLGRGLTRRSLGQRVVAILARLDDEPSLALTGGVDRALERLETAAELVFEEVGVTSSEAARVRRTLDLLSDGIVICDEQGREVLRNQRARSLLAARDADALASRAIDEALARAVGGGLRHVEMPLELFGPPRRTLVVRAAILDNGRRNLGAAAIVEDVTERTRLDAVRRDFVANVSHELRTPVGAIGILSEALSGETDLAVVERLSGRIQKESTRVARIIEDLLDLSRIESDATKLEQLEIGTVISEATDRAASLAESRGIDLIRAPSEPCWISGDRSHLVSALYNLIENAIKYSPTGSEVHIDCSSSGGTLELTVRDCGIGIPAKDLERIFERFYRVDQGRSRASGGTGLGLAIVRHVAMNHHGSVRVRSREGEGSSFTLRLPVAGRAAVDSETYPSDGLR